jgi:hypothetical protein
LFIDESLPVERPATKIAAVYSALAEMVSQFCDNLPARFIGIGPRPEHFHSPTVV